MTGDWRALAPPTSVPGRDELLVLIADPTGWAPLRARLEALLSDEERARAARFFRPGHGEAFTIAHGLLRVALGWALAREAAALAFTVGSHGKPAITDVEIGFNLSHTEGLIAIAIGAGEVGVDVEARAIPAEVIPSIASPRERAVIDAFDEPARPALLSRLWTRKEAVIKATGFGLSLPLTRIDVAPERETPVAIRDLPPPADPAAVYWVRDLPSHAGAVAMRGVPTAVRLSVWPPVPGGP